jgi:hypothetical protein
VRSESVKTEKELLNINQGNDFSDMIQKAQATKAKR